jgi:hypothetical protein
MVTEGVHPKFEYPIFLTWYQMKYQLTNYFMSLKPSKREIVHGPT